MFVLLQWKLSLAPPLAHPFLSVLSLLPIPHPPCSLHCLVQVLGGDSHSEGPWQCLKAVPPALPGPDRLLWGSSVPPPLRKQSRAQSWAQEPGLDGGSLKHWIREAGKEEVEMSREQRGRPLRPWACLFPLLMLQWPWQGARVQFFASLRSPDAPQNSMYFGNGEWKRSMWGSLGVILNRGSQRAQGESLGIWQGGGGWSDEWCREGIKPERFKLHPPLWVIQWFYHSFQKRKVPYLLPLFNSTKYLGDFKVMYRCKLLLFVLWHPSHLKKHPGKSPKQLHIKNLICTAAWLGAGVSFAANIFWQQPQDLVTLIKGRLSPDLKEHCITSKRGS